MKIYTEAHAALLKDRAGDAWMPSNGFEGDLFCDVVCSNCTHCDDFRQGCNITQNAMIYGKGDPEYPKEWVVSDTGQPSCTAFTPTKPKGETDGRG